MNEQQVVRGFLANIERVPPLIVRFQFNPSSIRDDKAVHYAEANPATGSEAPGLLYARGGQRTLSFELQLHGAEDPRDPAPAPSIGPLSSVAIELAALRSFLYPDEGERVAAISSALSGGGGSVISSPSRCVFGFGRRVLECIVTGMVVTETRFDAMLEPVRADVSITLTVIEEPGHPLYELDRAERIALATRGIAGLLRGGS